MSIPSINSTLIFCLALLVTSVSMAKETRVFTEGNVPSAEEMADILLNSAPNNRSKQTKTRSISFGVKESSAAVSIGLPIKFDLNSSNLNNNSLSYLKQLGSMLNLQKMINENIMIVGHTDTSGSEPYNLNLSKKRAQAVRDFLTSNYQIEQNRIKTVGKGESEILPGEPSTSALNRRVEFYRIQ